jgi:hypothetical protein
MQQCLEDGYGTLEVSLRQWQWCRFLLNHFYLLQLFKTVQIPIKIIINSIIQAIHKATILLFYSQGCLADSEMRDGVEYQCLSSNIWFGRKELKLEYEGKYKESFWNKGKIEQIGVSMRAYSF